MAELQLGKLHGTKNNASTYKLLGVSLELIGQEHITPWWMSSCITYITQQINIYTC